MVVPFNELPEEARIWVYQSNRKLSQQEVASITTLTSEFLSEWTAHGADLRAGFELRYDRFLVIGLDQRKASASGCSIDTSVRFIQSLEREFGIDLLEGYPRILSSIALSVMIGYGLLSLIHIRLRLWMAVVLIVHGLFIGREWEGILMPKDFNMGARINE